MLLLVSREAINARSSNVCTSPIDLRLDDSKFNIVNKEQQLPPRQDGIYRDHRFFQSRRPDHGTSQRKGRRANR